jgi:hypothetical protein
MNTLNINQGSEGVKTAPKNPLQRLASLAGRASSVAVLALAAAGCWGPHGGDRIQGMADAGYSRPDSSSPDNDNGGQTDDHGYTPGACDDSKYGTRLQLAVDESCADGEYPLFAMISSDKPNKEHAVTWMRKNPNPDDRVGGDNVQYSTESLKVGESYSLPRTLTKDMLAGGAELVGANGEKLPQMTPPAETAEFKHSEAGRGLKGFAIDYPAGTHVSEMRQIMAVMTDIGTTDTRDLTCVVALKECAGDVREAVQKAVQGSIKGRAVSGEADIGEGEMLVCLAQEKEADCAIPEGDASELPSQ